MSSDGEREREGEGAPTATSSTSPLSARELVEISLLHQSNHDQELSVSASGSVQSSYPLLMCREEERSEKTKAALAYSREENN